MLLREAMLEELDVEHSANQPEAAPALAAVDRIYHVWVHVLFVEQMDEDVSGGVDDWARV